MSKRPAIHPGPRVRWVQEAKTTDAEDAIFLASGYGLVPDDWQSPILVSWLGRRRDGKWCHGRCGLAVPRQNGKNAVIEIRELYGMVILGEAFLHTAHEVKTARKAFKRLKHFFGEKRDDPGARFPELNALVREVRNTNGQEAIFLHDVCTRCDQPVTTCQCGEHRRLRRGGSIEIIARSSGSGRGFTVDVLVLDEAQHLSDEDLEAIRSAVSSAPLGNPQVIYAGTPPNRDKGESGEVWTRVRSRAGKDKRLAWIEYGAADGPLPDLDDIDLLYRCNPALELQHANGAFGLQMDVVRDERSELSDAGYARERLGWWGDPDTKHAGVINLQNWAGLRVRAEAPTRVQIVIDISGNLEWSCVGVATDGPRGIDGDPRTLVLVNHDPGTGWVVDKVAQLVDDLETVEVAITPTAQLLSTALTRAGIEHHSLSNTEVGRGCTAFQEWIKAGTVAHVGQPELDAAVRYARTRFVGNTQHWDQRRPDVDITSLIAASTAAQRWRLNTAVSRAPQVPLGVDAGDIGRGPLDDLPDLNDVQF